MHPSEHRWTIKGTNSLNENRVITVWAKTSTEAYDKAIARLNAVFNLRPVEVTILAWANGKEWY